MAASSPIGPAPVTSTVRGSQKARWPTATTCSHAFATTVVGSSSTPRSPSEGSIFMAYSGSIRQRSDMKPSISLMPRSVYWPLRHMSHSPTAQLGREPGPGRRTMPTTRSPVLSAGLRTRVEHAAEGLVAEHEALLPGWGPAVFSLDDLDVGPADADGDRFDEHRAVAHIRLRDVFEPRGARLLRFDGDRFHVCVLLVSGRAKRRRRGKPHAGMSR